MEIRCVYQARLVFQHVKKAAHVIVKYPISPAWDKRDKLKKMP